MRTKTSTRKAGSFRRGVIVALFVLLHACSAGPPVQEMSDARLAIAAAKKAGAEEHAAEDLRAAEAFLDSAQRNLDERAYASARRDATQAKDKARKALKDSEGNQDEE